MTNFFTIAVADVFAAADPAINHALPYGKLYAGVIGVGFLAAVSLGSIAFYNSKRPVGWETKERPGFIPKMGQEEQE